jgi:hypothetical protein
MIDIHLQKRKVDIDQYRGNYASANHCSIKIKEPCRVFVDGADTPSVIMMQIPEEIAGLEDLLKSIKFNMSHRTGGLLSSSRTFGYAPRHAVRGREACAPAVLNYERESDIDVLDQVADLLNTIYKQENPALYAQHETITAEILDEWKINGTVFTSGIINKDNMLPYHFDRGNYANCWSNMVVLKKAMTGGHLSCPELDACFYLRNNSLLMFDGQSILHGVTPFHKVDESGYRYSIVYYSLQQMWRCLTKEEELERGKVLRSERELKKLKARAE